MQRVQGRGNAERAAGRRLRTEIYEPGDSRDVNISIEKFLGRPRSLDPFLKKIGIGKNLAGDSRGGNRAGISSAPR